MENRFDWPKLRKHIEFYEREGLCYLPAYWGRKNPALDSWEEYENRLPTMAEKADWFHEGKPIGIGVVCGGVSGRLLCELSGGNTAYLYRQESRS